MDAAMSLGHRPMSQALIEIAGQESNKRRMDPCIGVEAVNHLKPAAMPHRHRQRGTGCRVGAADRLETSVPKETHGTPLVTLAITHLAEHSGCRPGVCRKGRQKPLQNRRL